METKTSEDKLAEALIAYLAERKTIREAKEASLITETKKEKHKYVTINGSIPPEPESFFHTKKFLAIGAGTAVLIGIIYFLVVH